MTEPKPVVLPLHHHPITVCGCKVTKKNEHTTDSFDFFSFSHKNQVVSSSNEAKNTKQCGKYYLMFARASVESKRIGLKIVLYKEYYNLTIKHVKAISFNND